MSTVLAMKVIGAAALAAMVTTSLACGGKFERVPEADVDAQQKAEAERLATRFNAGCLSGTHEPLGEQEAIKEMREGLTPAKMAATCAGLKGQFGDYQSLDYAETWKPSFGSLRVYRFKGHFSNTPTTPEIRVVMDGPKLSGFWIKPWSDTLN